MLKINLLGTGGTMPMPDRPLTALLARYNGKSILIDCGAAFDEPLACLRLEDGEEFYIA